MEKERYPTCPLAQAGFRLECFSELGAVVIGPDDCCICTVDSRCRNVDKRSQERCTLEELETLDRQASYRRGWQSGGD